MFAKSKLESTKSHPALPKISADQIACSPGGLRDHFIGNSNQLAATLSDKLEPVSSQGRRELRIDGVSFTACVSGTRPVWAISARDLRKVSEIFHFKLKADRKISKISNVDVSCSVVGLSRYFLGGGKVSKALAVRLGTTDNFRKSKKILRVKSRILTFNLRSNENGRVVWSFAKRDLPKVARAFGFATKDHTIISPRSGEVVCSQSGLGKVFIGSGHEIALHMRKIIGDPNGSDAIEQTVVFEKQRAYFTKRKINGGYAWTFDRSAAEIVGRVLGKSVRSARVVELKEGEIACSIPGLQRHYIGSVERFREAISRLPVRFSGVGCRLGEGESSVSFERRLNCGHPVWGFNASEAHKVGALLGLTSRAEIDLVDELADAIALLGSDPVKLNQYLRIFYPHLSYDQALRATLIAIEGLGGESGKANDLLDYKERLDAPLMLMPQGTVVAPTSLEIEPKRHDSPYRALLGRFLKESRAVFLETKENSVTFRGRVSRDAESAVVSGSYSRTMAIDADGHFEARLPLPRSGEHNLFFVQAVNRTAMTVSFPLVYAISQQGEIEETEEAFLRLIARKEELLREIQKDPKRSEFLKRQLELSLLKSFTENEEAGLAKLEVRLKNEKSPGRKSILERIRDKFELISSVDYGLLPGRRMYFFQKYINHEVREARRRGEPGVIVAAEPGLGKTVATLALLQDQKVSVIAPNAVVTTWTSEERRFFKNPSLQLVEGGYSERDDLLAAAKPGRVVVNVEYTRGMNGKRRAGLSRECGTLVVDECDYLGARASQQSQGTRMLDAEFKILLSATPFKRHSQIGHVFGALDRRDVRFASAPAYARAFPPSSRSAMDALHLMVSERTIRIRKQDVFDYYDSNVPLAQQKDRLPRKNYISPEVDGRFVLLDAQCRSILELFTRYSSWCKKHRGRESSKDREYSRYSEGYFAKKEALRQIMNNPAYIGRPDLESPKHLKMDKIVGAELQEGGRKVLIFCRYKEQVAEYSRRYAKYGARTYYGDLPSNADGYRIDEQARVIHYAIDSVGEFSSGVDGVPELASRQTGRPMRALDYERLLFQNSAQHRVMIATYDAGAVGVTFTAADAVVFDDLAPTYRDEYQAGDRAHRIDNLRKKLAINFYWLEAQYPAAFLERIRGTSSAKYFKHGTFDVIVHENIKRQGKIFHRIMDGIGSDEEIFEIEQTLSQRMPFLFDRERESELVDELLGDVVVPSALVSGRDLLFRAEDGRLN